MLFPVFPHISPYIQSCQVPQYNFITDEQTKAIVGFNFLDDITVTFREDEQGTVMMFLHTLEALTWDREHKVFRDKQILAKQMAFITLDELNLLIPTIGWRFRGLRFKSMDTIVFDTSGDGTVDITAHFSVEQIFPTFPLNLQGAMPIP